MKWLAVLAGLVAAFFGIGLWNATRPPMVVEVALAMQGLAPGTSIRIAHLTDTHVGNPDMRRARLEAIVAQVNALKPDLIVLTGDYHGGKLLDWPRTRLEEGLEPFARLQAPLGVIAILGNHDESYWTRKLLAGQGSPKLLVNSHVDIGPLVIAGVDSAVRRPDLYKAVAGIAPGRPVLLLLHEPVQLLWQKAPRPMLALAGHTHGGQIILPFIGNIGDVITGKEPCPRGLCTLNGQRVFVSSGVGTSWVPIRYGVPPEIALITLTPPAENPAR